MHGATVMRTAAILPVKRFERAKQRLAGALGSPLRAALAQAMVADVLDALARCPEIERTLVVTGEPVLRGAAHTRRATMIEDASERGQSAAAQLGVQHALDEGFERVLCVPGDCPALDPDELGALLTARSGAGRPLVTIVPDRHGTGTNGLLLAPPDALAPAFGPGSLERHRSLARARGARVLVRRPASLLLDVDTNQDLDVLRARLERLPRRLARHTRACLARAQEGDRAQAAAAASVRAAGPSDPAARCPS
jgi:2-phospho-L-lactate guanylyltransferase